MEVPLHIGAKVDCKDSVKKWCTAVIIDRKTRTEDGVDTVKVHYVGWSEKWQEWIDVPTNPIETTFRIAPRGTHTSKDNGTKMADEDDKFLIAQAERNKGQLVPVSATKDMVTVSKEKSKEISKDKYTPERAKVLEDRLYEKAMRATEREEWKVAVDLFSELFNVNAYTVPYTTPLYFFHERGYAYLHLKNYDRAIDDAKDGLDLYKASLQARAGTKSTCDNIRPCGETLQRLLTEARLVKPKYSSRGPCPKLDPKFARIEENRLHKKALAAFDRKDWEEAVEYYDRCFEVNRYVVPYVRPLHFHINRGTARYKLGMYYEAEEDALDGLEIFNKTPDRQGVKSCEHMKQSVDMLNKLLSKAEAKVDEMESTSRMPNVRQCSVDGCAKEGIKECGQCKSEFYCSKKCQKRHWKGGHREICKTKGSADLTTAIVRTEDAAAMKKRLAILNRVAELQRRKERSSDDGVATAVKKDAVSAKEATLVGDEGCASSECKSALPPHEDTPVKNHAGVGVPKDSVPAKEATPVLKEGCVSSECKSAVPSEEAAPVKNHAGAGVGVGVQKDSVPAKDAPPVIKEGCVSSECKSAVPSEEAAPVKTDAGAGAAATTDSLLTKKAAPVGQDAGVSSDSKSVGTPEEASPVKNDTGAGVAAPKDVLPAMNVTPIGQDAGVSSESKSAGPPKEGTVVNEDASGAYNLANGTSVTPGATQEASSNVAVGENVVPRRTPDRSVLAPFATNVAKTVESGTSITKHASDSTRAQCTTGANPGVDLAKGSEDVSPEPEAVNAADSASCATRRVSDSAKFSYGTKAPLRETKRVDSQASSARIATLGKDDTKSALRDQHHDEGALADSRGASAVSRVACLSKAAASPPLETPSAETDVSVSLTSDDASLPTHQPVIAAASKESDPGKAATDPFATAQPCGDAQGESMKPHQGECRKGSSNKVQRDPTRLADCDSSPQKNDAQVFKAREDVAPGSSTVGALGSEASASCTQKPSKDNGAGTSNGAKGKACGKNASTAKSKRTSSKGDSVTFSKETSETNEESKEHAAAESASSHSSRKSSAKKAVALHAKTKVALHTKTKVVLHACERPECDHTERRPKEFMMCGGCRVRYCSRECATSHWKAHKRTHKAKAKTKANKAVKTKSKTKSGTKSKAKSGADAGGKKVTESKLSEHSKAKS